ncbi:PAS domain-containing protein [Roseomonas marmotae]|uniref:histidine kinase n=1 Tax=Roseomonas marmotae TaxID=2768161 RepID=A0ABS3KC10_9PROT|nr:PAS domain-containing protein [Roseomonas marmotae]MBO1073881.1 PAS domain-containing protein [Roseomonas marmotae]QTI78497.1 PAS domain-containing protein [Roseomonas marmotae]
MGSTSLSRRFGPAALGLAALLLAGGVTVSLAMDRAATERQALREVGLLADTMAVQASALLGGLDRAVLGLAQLMASQAPPDDVSLALATRESALQDGVVLAVLRPDGSIEFATAAGHRRLAGLQHGAVTAVAASRQLTLGTPLRSVNGPVLPLTQLLPDDRVVLALLPLRLLEGLYAQLDLGADHIVALLDQDGRLVTRIPAAPPEAVGQDFRDAATVALGPQPHQGWNGRVVSPIDNQRRFTAWRPVPGYPAVVAFGRGDDSAMVQWTRRAWMGGSLTLLAIAAAGLGMLLVGREARRRLDAQAAATTRLEQLARGSAGIAAVSELPALLSHVSQLTREALRAPFACVTLHDGDRQEQSSKQQVINLAPRHGLSAPMLDRLERWATDRERAAEAAPRIWPAGADGLPARACIGLRDEQGQPLGALSVAAAPGDEAGFQADEEAMLAQFARLAEIAIRNRGLIAAAHRAAEEAGSARERVERLLEAVSDGFVALDASWCITYANTAALRLAGRTREEVLSQPIWDLYPELTELEVFENLQTVASRGQPLEFEQHLEAPQRWFEAYAFPAADGVAVFFREVTEARRNQYRMRQSQRMETVGRLAGSVAHDFNNLLTVVAGNAEMLEEDLEHDPGARHAAVLIRDAAERGRTLVRQLLAFAGHQPEVTPREVAPEELVDRLMPLLRRLLGAKVRLDVRKMQQDLPRLRLVPEQAENAIINLAVNARDAMPDGGTLTLTLEAVELDAGALLEVPDARPGRFLRLTVSDTGTGMTPEVMAHALEPFFSTKGADHGAGLGLVSVNSFARENRGLLQLTSIPGQGTDVALILPEAWTPEPVPEAIEPPLPRGDESVLLVEDEAALRQTLARQVSALGYRVTAVEGGPQALAALDDGLRPDLLLSDVILPGGISGPRLAQLLRQRLPAMRVLLISGYALREMEEVNGMPLLAKPLNGAVLAHQLRQLLDTSPAHITLKFGAEHTQGLV